MSILITGATGAIGYGITLKLSDRDYEFIIACRDLSKGKILAGDLAYDFGLKAEVIHLDLSSSESVLKVVSDLGSTKIQGIINNAGVMNGSFKLDPDGYEDTLNVNYHNTRLLTEKLIPNIEPGGAIVFTTSATRHWYPFQKLRENVSEKEFGRLKTYALSKKLITRYALQLAARLKERQIRVNCADPGVVDTPMLKMNKWFDPLTDKFFRPLCLNSFKAANVGVRAFLSPETGKIYSPTLSDLTSEV